MANIAARRIQRELEEINSEEVRVIYKPREYFVILQSGLRQKLTVTTHPDLDHLDVMQYHEKIKIVCIDCAKIPIMNMCTILKVAKCGIKVRLVDNNYTKLKGEITGPPDTPYEGGKFVLEIWVPKTYPFKPPRVRFITKIWHPNISSVTETICLTIIKDQWAATMTLIVWLRLDFGDSPQNLYAAKQFKSHREMFQMTARHWTSAYAGSPHVNEEFDDKIKKLIYINIDEECARHWLSINNWDLEQTAEQLLSE